MIRAACPARRPACCHHRASQRGQEQPRQCPGVHASAWCCSFYLLEGVENLRMWTSLPFQTPCVWPSLGVPTWVKAASSTPWCACRSLVLCHPTCWKVYSSCGLSGQPFARRPACGHQWASQCRQEQPCQCPGMRLTLVNLMLWTCSELWTATRMQLAPSMHVQQQEGISMPCSVWC